MMRGTAIKERPIIFSAPMVRAILYGRKTQTRQVIQFSPHELSGDVPHRYIDCVEANDDGDLFGRFIAEGFDEYVAVKQPWYQRGDRMWVKETWAEFESAQRGFRKFIRYKAEMDDWAEPGVPKIRWRSPIHMPRWASRITLEITDVRVQRVQEISEEDAMAEGIPWDSRAFFQQAWDSLNAKRGYSWESNPFVRCITFRRGEP